MNQKQILVNILSIYSEEAALYVKRNHTEEQVEGCIRALDAQDYGKVLAGLFSWNNTPLDYNSWSNLSETLRRHTIQNTAEPLQVVQNLCWRSG